MYLYPTSRPWHGGLSERQEYVGFKFPLCRQLLMLYGQLLWGVLEICENRRATLPVRQHLLSCHGCMFFCPVTLPDYSLSSHHADRYFCRII